MSIQVIATREGYYGGHVRKVDLVPFAVQTKKHISKRWMLEVGTPEYDAYVNKTSRDYANSDEAKIEAERLAVGGLQEELAVALSENKRLTRNVAELEEQVRVLKDRDAVIQEPVEDASIPQNDDAPAAEPEEVEEETAPTRKRRRK